MPFKSEAQRRYLYANRPKGVDLAEWDAATKKKKLPKRVSKAFDPKEMRIEREPDDAEGNRHYSGYRGTKNVGYIKVTSDDKIGYIKTIRRYRRKGVATHMKAHAERDLGRPISHGTDLSRKGRKFAKATPVKKSAFGVDDPR